MNIKDSAPYYVWRRDDGHIGATRYVPGRGTKSTFEILGVFDEWEPALDLINKERLVSLNKEEAMVKLT